MGRLVPADRQDLAVLVVPQGHQVAQVHLVHQELVEHRVAQGQVDLQVRLVVLDRAVRVELPVHQALLVVQDLLVLVAHLAHLEQALHLARQEVVERQEAADQAARPGLVAPLVHQVVVERVVRLLLLVRLYIPRVQPLVLGLLHTP